MNRYIGAISVLATEAIKLGLIRIRPEMVRRREGQPRSRIFTEREEDLVLQTIEAWGYEDHTALYAFLTDTGCRQGEVQRLLWADFVGDKIHLEAEITKNSTRRTLTGTPRALAAVETMRGKYERTYPGPFTWATRGLYRTRKLWQGLREHFAAAPARVVSSVDTVRLSAPVRLSERTINRCTARGSDGRCLHHALRGHLCSRMHHPVTHPACWVGVCRGDLSAAVWNAACSAASSPATGPEASLLKVLVYQPLNFVTAMCFASIRRGWLVARL